MLDSLKSYIDYKDSILNKELSQLKDSISIKTNTPNSFLNISEDWWTHVVLPIGIPLLSFLLLRFLYYFRDKRKLIRDLKDKQDFLFTWIDLIAEPIKKQTLAYSSFANHLQNLEFPEDGLHSYNLCESRVGYRTK